jgi:hypothetical protein
LLTANRSYVCEFAPNKKSTKLGSIISLQTSLKQFVEITTEISIDQENCKNCEKRSAWDTILVNLEILDGRQFSSF